MVTRRQKAFTLIELLVVIAVIAILMAILMPALQRAKEQAKAVACQAKLKNWGTRFVMCTNDNDGRLIGYREYYSTAWAAQDWLMVMHRYYSDGKDLLLCPVAVKPNEDPKAIIGSSGPWIGPGPHPPDCYGGKLRAWQLTVGTLRSVEGGPPVVEQVLAVRGSYGMNLWVGTDATYYGKDRCWGTPSVAGAAGVPVLLDCLWTGAAPANDLEHPPDYDSQIWPNHGMPHFCINRHRGFVNSLFLDWSVRKVGLKELWTLKWHRQYNTAGMWTTKGGILPSNWPQWMHGFKDYP